MTWNSLSIVKDRACCSAFVGHQRRSTAKYGVAHQAFGEALAIYREKFPDRYVENYTMLARVVRLEADVKHSLATPKTVDEALDQLESKVGKAGRQKFEKFLREVGELDDEDDVIDAESE